MGDAMMNLARKLLLPPGMILWWLVQIAVKLPTVLLGFLVVPFLYRKRYTPLRDMPWWSKPWANPEDWYGGLLKNTDSLPKWWKKRMGDGFWAFYKYHAIRNPADGLRNFPKWNLRVSKHMVHYWTPKYYDHYDPWYVRREDPDFTGVIGYAAWSSVWLGVKVQWYRKESYSEFKFGFRVEPRDAHHDLHPSSARAKLGASFASKLIPNRKL